MFTQEQLLPISALQHLQFCPRQWGLIHLEQIWSDNALTAEGNLMHSRVHSSQSESRDDIRIARGLRICSFELGLIGQADVVEFRRIEPKMIDGQSSGTKLPEVEGLWRVFPVEYKRGKPKKDKSDEVQLCAQVMCLEEMLDVRIEQAALFYGMPRKRKIVSIDQPLRQRTGKLAALAHRLYESGQTPRAKYCRKCENCSLLGRCLPRVTGINKKIDSYIAKGISDETIA